MPDEATEDSIGFIATIPDNPEKNWKVQMSAGQHRFFRSINSTLEHSYEFFELLRWVVFKEDEDVPEGRTFGLEKFDHKNPGIQPLSVCNEKKAWNYLK
jgi:hypothetical protein